MSLKTEILSSLNTLNGIAFPIQAWSSQTWHDLPPLSQEQIQLETELLSKPAGSIVPKQVSHYLSTKKIHTIAYYVLSWLTWPFHVRFSTKPPRHFYEFIGIPTAIGYFWQSIKVGYRASYKNLHKWFGVTHYHLKVFAIAYIGLCILARWIEQWSGIVQSVELAEKEYRNLTAEVRDNPIHLLTTQRSVQIGQIALALTDMDSKAVSDQFPMLVGPAGTGKTSAIINLVYQVEKLNQYPALRGKTFYSVNTAQWAFQKKNLTEGTRDSEWSEYGKLVVSTEPLLAFLKILEGKENNTVVFFDEAQCFDDACIELLKTCIG
ncbi:MAG TPA: DNA/RNA helicase domain-containing protein [Rhabdochlamydiaceae bacterium]|nr:DNA/RNA helicase domain-containing protein [Rhabdochlamydiaceae bacterium]